MRIAVFADTHVGDLRKTAPEGVWRLADSADVIAHLGDFVDDDFAERFSRGREVFAVAGNRDSEWLERMYPVARTVDFGGVRIFMRHEFPLHSAAREAPALRSEGVSIVLCGHTHKPCDAEAAGLRMLNPGSAGDRRRSGALTAGVLTVTNGRADWQIVDLQRLEE